MTQLRPFHKNDVTRDTRRACTNVAVDIAAAI